MNGLYRRDGENNSIKEVFIKSGRGGGQSIQPRKGVSSSDHHKGGSKSFERNN